MLPGTLPPGRPLQTRQCRSSGATCFDDGSRLFLSHRLGTGEAVPELWALWAEGVTCTLRLFQTVTKSGNGLPTAFRPRYGPAGDAMLQNILPDIEKLESHLRGVVPGGYMLALNIRYLTP